MDEFQNTSRAGIYAVGDVCGRALLTPGTNSLTIYEVLTKPTESQLVHIQTQPEFEPTDRSCVSPFVVLSCYLRKLIAIFVYCGSCHRCRQEVGTQAVRG